MRKVVDLVDNRVESNMKAISNTMLVDLPSDRSFTYEEFISSQAKFQRKQAEILAVRNEEVGCALSCGGKGLCHSCSKK